MADTPASPSTSPPSRLADDLLGDPDFRRLLDEFARRVLTWDEFLEMNMPAGMSPVRTWDLVVSLSSAIGLRVPIIDPDGTDYWYRRTYQLSDTVHEVAAACGSESHIHRAITASGGEHFMVKMRLDETIASARLDGLNIDEKAVARLEKGGVPRSSSEQLISNVNRVANRIPDLIDRPFSPALFRKFHDELLRGLDEADLPRSPAKLGMLTYSAGLSGSPEFSARQIEHIAAYANHTAGDPFDPPVLRAYMIAFALHMYQPLGAVSAMVGRLAAQLYSMKHNLPVLALLPISRLKIEWEDGLIVPPLVACDRPTFDALRRRKRSDLTVHQTIIAQLMKLAVNDIENYIDEWERRDRRMRELLRKDPGLNQRQRSVVSRALRSPEAEFTIRYHEHNHAIAYATARRDLLELAEKHYLTMHVRGKAFVFTASPDLHTLVESDDTAHGEVA